MRAVCFRVMGRIVALLSIALNIFLLGMACRRTEPQPGDSPERAVAPPLTESNQTPRTPSLPTNAGAISIRVTDQFHWSRMESTNFSEYIANLRSIGCPPDTIRDLIGAEIDRLFAPRLARLATEAVEHKYWQGHQPLKGVLRRKLDLLQAEKRRLLLTLLGDERTPPSEWLPSTIEELADQAQFAFLHPDKQGLVRGIVQKYERLLHWPERPHATVRSDPETMRQREERRQDLARVLTPEELHEFDLRDSNTAESVRSQFGMLDLTEEQYRQLFALRRAYENEHGPVADYSDPEKVSRRTEARRELERAYQRVIGGADERRADLGG